MTEKTPKTPSSNQANDSSKDQANVSDVTKPDHGATAPKVTPTDKPAAATTGPATASVKPDATGSKLSEPKPSASKVASKSLAASKTPSPTAPKGSGSDSTAKTSGTGGGSNGGATPPVSSEPPQKKPSYLPLAVISVAVVLLAGGLWYQHATSKGYIERLESQARISAEQARSAEQKAQQALDSLSQQQGMLTDLRSELQESKAELRGLGTAFQTITDRGSDLVLLNDIDHLVVIAQQQLQLNGNVANAIISLETAQAQLARANRPALSSLQQTINGDLDRLRAATTVDMALLSSRLDELAGLISQAPLLVPDDARPELERAPNGSAPGPDSPETDSTEGEWWEKALSRTQQWTAHTFASLRHELGQFVSVRRVDDAAALLISPDQAARFRDSLRQRIMTAQLALMMDQALIWETETDALLKAIETRFDSQSAVTRQAVRIAREVADTEIDSQLPDVSNTIKALEAMNEQMGRGSLPPQSTTEPPAAEAPSQEPSQAESALTENDVSDADPETVNNGPEADDPAQPANDTSGSAPAAEADDAEIKDDARSDDAVAAQGSDNADDGSGDAGADDTASEQNKESADNTGLKL